MDFINRVGRAQRIALVSLLHPLLIVPFVVQGPKHRSRARRLFMHDADRISLIDTEAMTVGFDVELVEIAMVCARSKSFPDSRRSARVQAMSLRIPSIETADHRH